MLKMDYNDSTNTLTISGEGNISWRDTVEFSEDTKHVVIKGNGVFCMNASALFAQFSELIDIEGTIDTSKCEDFSYMYAECFKLERPIIDLNTISGTEFDFMHSDNQSLREIAFNSTSKGIKFRDMFLGCVSIEVIRNVTVKDSEQLSDISDIPSVRDMISIVN